MNVLVRTTSLSELCGTVSAQSGTNYADLNPSTHNSRSQNFQVLDYGTGSVLNTTPIPDNEDCTWRQITVSDSTDAGRRVKFAWNLTTTPDGTFTLSTVNGYVFSGSVSFYYLSTQTNAGGSILLVDNIQGGSSTITSGSFTSQTFDTGFSSPIVSVSISSTSNTEPITFVLRHSSFTSGGFSDLTTLQNTSTQSNRYLQYITTFTVGGGDNGALSSLNSASLQWTASSGTLKSQIHNFGSITSFGNFVVQDVLNSGNIAFSICSSTMSTMSPASACTAQTANTQISISTGTGGSGTYVQWYATFTVTATTQTPTLQSVTVQAYAGNHAVPMASTVWDNRYWLSLTTSTADSANDSVLVLNSQGHWADFDIHAGAFTQYKNSLYHADSTATGNIYLDNQAYADNGAAINAYVKTKDFSMGDLSRDHYLYGLYPSMDNGGNCDVTFQYTPDKSTSTYSLGTVSQSEFATQSSVRLPVPVDSTHQNFGRTFNFRVGTADAVCPWTFYGFRGIYRQRPIEGTAE